jgi:hypothetical protein
MRWINKKRRTLKKVGKEGREKKREEEKERRR